MGTAVTGSDSAYQMHGCLQGVSHSQAIVASKWTLPNSTGEHAILCRIAALDVACCSSSMGLKRQKGKSVTDSRLDWRQDLALNFTSGANSNRQWPKLIDFSLILQNSWLLVMARPATRNIPTSDLQTTQSSCSVRTFTRQVTDSSVCEERNQPVC